MTGRARGRSRGRGRTDAPPPGFEDVARRPGETAAAAPVWPRNGTRGPTPAAPQQQAAVSPVWPRNGTRGSPPVAPQQQAAAAPVVRNGTRGSPPATPQQVAAAPPTAAMANMAVSVPPRGQRMNGEAIMYLPTGQNKLGSTGTRVALATNSYMLERRPNFMIYQYHVTFSPEVDFKKVRLGLIADQQQLLGRVRAFDGMTLYLPTRLPHPVTKIVGLRRRRDNPDGEPVEITITLTNELPESSPISIHLYNIILKRILKIRNMKQVGRDYFFPDLARHFPESHLEIWPGYKTAIKRLDAGTLVNVDVDHKILRTQTVLEVLYDMTRNPRNQRNGNNCFDNAKKKLMGQIVITRYNNKTYRIDDIDWNIRPHHTFSTSHGEISYVDYYAKTYDKQITDLEQPMIISKPKRVLGETPRPVHLIPELCYLTGLTDEMRADHRMMKDVNAYTRLAPRERTTELKKFISNINGNEEASQELQGWGLQFGRSLMQLEGRVLPPETLFQKDKKFSYDARSADWSREIRGNPLHSAVNLENWLIVHVARETNLATDLKEGLERVGGPMGMRISRPRMVGIENDRTENYLRAIRSELDRERPQAVVIISNSNRKDQYDAIKKLCCLEKPVPSQVVLKKTLDKRQMLMSVCTKIAIQLNCKLGGEAWATEIPLKGLMVIGIDTYHDSSEKGRSVGGFVASINQSLTRYYSRCTFQHNRQELIDGLKVCMIGALREWHKVNGSLPDKIILYRDGVGEGQLKAVQEHEVSQMIQAFSSLPGVDYKPNFAVVVVTKRISTRLFLKDPRDSNMTNLNNPPPGTVVDRAVTNPEWFDFFLVSQSVRQGTVTPAHYNVIHNTFSSSVLTPDRFQRLSYRLTHLYYNWPGTIRVPAPCQYAHKLAFLVGQSLHKEPHISLADKLYYI